MTQIHEDDLYQIISDEHAKQLHLKETLKIEAEQSKAAKEKELDDHENGQKLAVLERKTKTDIQLSQEDCRRKSAVEDFSRSCGESGILADLAKLLNEFLSKSKVIHNFSAIAIYTSLSFHRPSEYDQKRSKEIPGYHRSRFL